MPAKYEIHPAANIFPMLDAVAFAELKADIEAHGVRECVTIFDGKIIDGRNRYKAMTELGIDPACYAMELEECDDPIAYVLSLNLHRRHLTTSQRALVAARVRDIYDERARERMSSGGGDKKSEAAKANGKSGKEKLPTPIQSRDEAGAVLGVSGKSVDTARIVLEQGSAALIAKVDAGEVSVSKAAKIAVAHDKRSQVAALDDPPPRKPESTYLTQARKLFDSLGPKERQMVATAWSEWMEAE